MNITEVYNLLFELAHYSTVIFLDIVYYLLKLPVGK